MKVTYEKQTAEQFKSAKINEGTVIQIIADGHNAIHAMRSNSDQDSAMWVIINKDTDSFCESLGNVGDFVGGDKVDSLEDSRQWSVKIIEHSIASKEAKTFSLAELELGQCYLFNNPGNRIDTSTIATGDIVMRVNNGSKDDYYISLMDVRTGVIEMFDQESYIMEGAFRLAETALVIKG